MNNPHFAALVARLEHRRECANRDAEAIAITSDRATIAVRRELDSLCWDKPSKASVVSCLAQAIQRVDACDEYATGLLNDVTRTVITEIYAIEDWPTTKEVVAARVAAAIRRLS